MINVDADHVHNSNNDNISTEIKLCIEALV